MYPAVYAAQSLHYLVPAGNIPPCPGDEDLSWMVYFSGSYAVPCILAGFLVIYVKDFDVKTSAALIWAFYAWQVAAEYAGINFRGHPLDSILMAVFFAAAIIMVILSFIKA